MSQKLIIGITGKKGSGKDTLGQFFINNYNFKRFAFADTLKEVCRLIFCFTDEQLYGDKKEVIDFKWKETPRKILQFIGTDLFRNQLENLLPDVKKNIWTLSLENKIDKYTGSVVITDIRFQNEVDLIKSYPNSIMIHIKRNNNNVDLHESEKYIDDLTGIDYYVDNNYCLETLNYESKKIIEKYFNTYYS